MDRGGGRLAESALDRTFLFAESSRWIDIFDSGGSSRLGVLDSLGGLLHVVLVPESG